MSWCTRSPGTGSACRPWIAALAAVPVLYDGFQIELEHLILSDVLFEFLLVLATTLLLWDSQALAGGAARSSA